MTKKQIDRALLKLFNVEDWVIPRCAMSPLLYHYVQALWAKSPEGRREIKNRGW
jgi:hypothetical protein